MFSDIAFTAEGLVVIGGLLTMLTGAIVKLFYMLKDNYDQRLVQITLDRDSYKRMADEAIVSLEKAVNASLQLQGKPPFVPLAPVIPEHSSPITLNQQSTANVQTLRARLTAANLHFEDVDARNGGSPRREE